MKIVKTINSEIFRSYDLRGVVDIDLNADVMYTLGRAYATFLSERRIKESTIGRDNRLTGEEYSKAFIQGMNDGGINTIDIGLSLSQIVYFSSYYFQIKGSVMISASHNPKNFNGLKLGVGYSDTMITEEIQHLRQIVEIGQYSEGKGTNRSEDIFSAYKTDILKRFSLKKKWKIVVEGCNTGSGVFYPTIFRDAGCEVIEQNCIPDGSFPLGVPDPTEIKVLERLAKRIKQEKADIGFAYDTDGDRMSVVDENGSIIWMDSIVALFAQDVLDLLP
ncbi:phosphomannomutase, partial [Candidatus Collierbacteria bacterium CG17_big_fil_post_rev_8_21_14_2_50_45_7]